MCLLISKAFHEQKKNTPTQTRLNGVSNEVGWSHPTSRLICDHRITHFALEKIEIQLQTPISIICSSGGVNSIYLLNSF